MNKINLTTIVLLVYLAAVSFFSWPGKQLEPDYIKYFSVIGITLLIIVILRIFQIKLYKKRKDRGTK